MATIKSYTDLEQSKRLAEILPLESADMYTYKNIFFGALSCFNSTTQIGEYIKLSDKESKAYPCWSLAALLSVLPKIQGSKPIIALDDNYITYPLPHRSDLHTKADNLVDAAFEMIIELHQLNLL